MGEDDEEEKNDARNELILRRSLFEESDLLFSQQPSTLCRLASNPIPSPPGEGTTTSKKTKKTKKKKTNDDKEEVQQQQNPNNNDKSSSSMENVVGVACKVYACEEVCENKYQIRSKTCRSCLNAKEVFVEKGDEMASRFCQKCTKFHGVDMFEGGRKACKMSLKKVQEKNKVIFAKQKMLLKEWEEAMMRRTTTTTTTAVKRSTKAKKEKKKTKSQENLSEESKARNTIMTSDTQTMNNRKTMILKPCTMDSLYSTDENHESEAAAADAPIVTKTMGRDQQQSCPVVVPVNRVDRLLEAIKAEKRKESLLDLNLVNGGNALKKKRKMMAMTAAREEEDRREEEEEEEEEEGIDDPMEGEEGEDDDERKEHTVNAKKPLKIKKLPFLVSRILARSVSPTLSVVRSITPTLYREAMESKLNEFRGLSSKLSPPPPKD